MGEVQDIALLIEKGVISAAEARRYMSTVDSRWRIVLSPPVVTAPPGAILEKKD